MLELPTVKQTLSDAKRVLIKNGIIYLTTANAAYYKGGKFTFDELKNTLKIFEKVKIMFYNTYPKNNNRILSISHVLPKVKSKFVNEDKIINDLNVTTSLDVENTSAGYIYNSGFNNASMVTAHAAARTDTVDFFDRWRVNRTNTVQQVFDESCISCHDLFASYRFHGSIIYIKCHFIKFKKMATHAEKPI